MKYRTLFFITFIVGVIVEILIASFVKSNTPLWYIVSVIISVIFLQYFKVKGKLEL